MAKYEFGGSFRNVRRLQAPIVGCHHADSLATYQHLYGCSRCDRADLKDAAGDVTGSLSTDSICARWCGSGQNGDGYLQGEALFPLSERYFGNHRHLRRFAKSSRVRRSRLALTRRCAEPKAR